MLGRRPSKESMFRLASLEEPRVMRTGKGRETGTGYTKPDAPLHWPQEATTCLQPKQSSWHWDRSKSTGVGKQFSRIKNPVSR